jgi:hypothetical protein
MSIQGCNYAILAVTVMPKGAKNYFTEFSDEGTIFVTSKNTCKQAYGALRAILLSEYMIGRKAGNLQSVLSNMRIQDAIASAFRIADHLKSIRKKTKSIIEKAKGIKIDSDAADVILAESLTELQKRIHGTIESLRQGENEKEEVNDQPNIFARNTI